MRSNAFETARSRYRAAYDAYRAVTRRIAQKLESGSHPLPEEIAAEAKAAEALELAHRELLAAKGTMGSP